jgi:polar amino acid transport system substrate-binding protein
MNRRYALPLLFYLACIFPIRAAAEPFPAFKIMTEDWRPYNYEEQGVPKGLAVDTLVLMLQRVGSQQGRGDIHFYPWERGYQTIQMLPRVILFSMTRTPERDPLFKWVGPLADNTVSLFALKSRHIVVNSAADLKKFKIDTYVGSVSGELLVTKFGLKPDGLDRSNTQATSLQKVMLGRGDMFPASVPTLQQMCATLPCKLDDFEPVFELNRAHLYYALSKDTPDAVVAQLQKSFDELKAEGVLAGLTRQYQP